MTTPFTDQLHDVLRRLRAVRSLPPSHPDRAAWLADKESLLAELRAERSPTPGAQQ